jgi:acetylornithine deacetylase/succinyl-diaminopimelate desuccinylase-like protein
MAKCAAWLARHLRAIGLDKLKVVPTPRNPIVYADWRNAPSGAGGYQGTGVKAAIPARAVAKLNFRLVPDQDPFEIERLFRDHVTRITPEGVQTCVRTLMRAKPALVDRTHPAIVAAARAYHQAFGAPAVFLRNGGTIPVVNLIHEALDTPVVLMGFGLPDDHIHGPNEKFHLRFLVQMGARQGASHARAVSHLGSGKVTIAPRKELIL